jgi:hypothetical protein
VAAIVVSAVVFVPLALYSGTGFANTSAAQYQYRVTICHHTHSASHPLVTITISSAAWKAHQKHHDTLGPCPPPPTTTASSSTVPPPAATSGSSPGQSGDSHGQSGDSHGQSGDSHGQSGDSHGQSSDSHGQSGDSHGQSGSAPGHNK